ncbi:MAG: lysylphosphatidylglycerol synthase transmembrane domain-containing protein [Acidobacteriota bacterium]
MVGNGTPVAGEVSGSARRAPKVGSALLGYGIALGCLIWVFHDVRWAALFSNLTAMNWWWVALAIVLDVAGYISQGWRWSLLLRALGRFSTLDAAQAIYSGLFVNEVLPLRVGEVLRGYLAARRLQTGIPAIVSSMMVERFFDAVWLALAVGATILLVPLPHYMLEAEEFLAGLVFAATALFVYLVLRPEKATGENLETAGIAGRLRRMLAQLGGGIRDIGRSGQLYAGFAVSSLVLICQILAYWLVMRGYGMRLSFWHGAAVLLIVHLGTLIPGAPSNIGTYQFFSVLGLTQFGIDKTLAGGFSVVVFLVLTIPLWAIGVIAFGRSGMTLQQIRRHPGIGTRQ